MGLTHFDEAGRARMVDISEKAETAREATAAGSISMRPETLALIRAGGLAKGDVLAVAQVAGILAAKQTPQIIPMCHALLLTGVELAFELEEAGEGREARVGIRAVVRTVGKTGAEMEALTAVSVAALTIYDMCKAVDRAMTIGEIRLLRKSGGKSGTFERAEEQTSPPAPLPEGAASES
jgi:cyclic pyranopterin phosphate synthase